MTALIKILNSQLRIAESIPPPLRDPSGSTVIIDETQKKSFWCVEFLTETGLSQFRYTDSPDPIFTGNSRFDRTFPEMSLKTAANSGGLKTKPWAITLPFESDDFTDHISSGRPYPRTFVNIIEYVRPANPTIARIETRWHFTGIVTDTERNPSGRRDMVQIEAVELKAFLEAATGLPVTAQCQWVFGKNGCFKSFTGLTESLDIVKLEGTKVTTSALSTTRAAKHFVRGFMQVGDLFIEIRDWDSAVQNVFYMTEKPPIYWIDQTATVNPGCDKDSTTCNDLWSNINNVGGAGFGMPDFNPIAEGAEL